MRNTQHNVRQTWRTISNRIWVCGKFDSNINTLFVNCLSKLILNLFLGLAKKKKDLLSLTDQEKVIKHMEQQMQDCSTGLQNWAWGRPLKHIIWHLRFSYAYCWGSYMMRLYKERLIEEAKKIKWTHVKLEPYSCMSVKVSEQGTVTVQVRSHTERGNIWLHTGTHIHIEYWNTQTYRF